MESVTKASFGLLETLRVVLPGYYFSATGYVLLFVLGVAVGPLKEESLVSLVIGLGVGFGLYSLNLPNKRAVYEKNQPSEHLQKLSHEMSRRLNRPEIDLKKFDAVGTYLYVLNNYFPQTFHEVVMVRGALWYCMTYFGMISLFFSFLATVALALSYIPCISVHFAHLGSAAVFIVAELGLGILIFTTGRTDRMLQAVYKDQILWMDLNKRLLEYILSKREDPKLNRLLGGNSIEGDREPG
jgi:hypothetical protein